MFWVIRSGCTQAKLYSAERMWEMGDGVTAQQISVLEQNIMLSSFILQ